MTDAVAPEYARFIADERRANRVAAVARPMAEGEVFKPVTLEEQAGHRLPPGRRPTRERPLPARASTPKSSGSRATANSP